LLFISSQSRFEVDFSRFRRLYHSFRRGLLCAGRTSANLSWLECFIDLESVSHCRSSSTFNFLSLRNSSLRVGAMIISFSK
jgi:hypothetical protein